MRALLQRVREASASVGGEVVGRIGPGLLILLGVRNGDTGKELEFVAEKCLNLRIFPDSEGRLNRSVLDLAGELLVVSQFTLYADPRKGRRPSFADAAPPPLSRPLYDRFVQRMEESGLRTATGRFGADMEIALVNDGPVTILVEKEHA